MPVKNYLNNKELYKEIIVSKAMGRLTPKGAHFLTLFGKNIIKKMNYKNPLDKEDCLQECNYQLFKNWYLFDETKSANTFAYFTEIAKRGFAQGFNKFYKKDKQTGEYIHLIYISSFYEDNKDLQI